MPGLRKGRERCGALCRDGHPCQAPAIPFGLVCRRHGGAAPQVLIASGLMYRQWRRYTAALAWNEAQGTNRAFDALCALGNAERELDAYKAKLARLAGLRALLAEQRAAAPRRREAG